MKKMYMTPEVEITEMEIQAAILQVSGGTIEVPDNEPEDPTIAPPRP